MPNIIHMSGIIREMHERMYEKRTSIKASFLYKQLIEGDIAPHTVGSCIRVVGEIIHRYATRKGMFVGVLREQLTFYLVGVGIENKFGATRAFVRAIVSGVEIVV